MLLKRPLNKRAFLKATAGLLPLPFMESLVPQARAQSAAKPIRIVNVVTLHGVPYASRANDWVDPEVGRLGELKKVFKPLKAYKDNLLVVSGLNMESVVEHPNLKGLVGVGHEKAAPFVLTGSYSQASYDYQVSQYMQHPVPYRHSYFRVPGGWNDYYFAFSDKHTAIGPINSNQNIYNRYFSDLSGTQAVQYPNAQANRQAMFDLLRAELDRLQRKVSLSDRDTLSQYHADLLELERALNAAQPASACTAPTDRTWTRRAPDTQNSVDQVFDLTAHALACDLTRVATIDIHAVQSGQTYDWLTEFAAVPKQGDDTTIQNNKQSHHAASHNVDNASNAYITGIRAWHGQRLADFCNKLSSMPDSDGDTVMDNTIIYWTTEVAHGQTHSVKDMPLAIIAGKNTGIKQGGFHIRHAGRPHNDLLASLAVAAGMPTSTQIGAAKYNTGLIDIFS